MTIWAVMGAGALGVGARFALERHWVWDPSRGFWSVTLAINVVGSALMGVLLAWFGSRAGISQEWKSALTAGFLGGFTTFSAYSAQTLILIQSGQWGHALLYGIFSPVLAVGACALGFGLVSSVVG